MNGIPLEAPYLTVLRFENTGSKPVAAAEFEFGPELKLAASAKFVSAKVSKSEPPELMGSLLVEPGRVTIQPLLLNPGDSLAITVLTSGGKPAFEARARIVGVITVPFVAQAASGQPTVLLVLEGLGSTLTLFCAALAMNLEPSPKFDVLLRSRAAVTVFYTLFAASIGLLFPVLEHFGYSSWWQAVLVILALLALVSFPARAWNRSPRGSVERHDVA